MDIGLLFQLGFEDNFMNDFMISPKIFNPNTHNFAQINSNDFLNYFFEIFFWKKGLICVFMSILEAEGFWGWRESGF